MSDELLIAHNPEEGTTLPYLVRLPLGDDGIVLKTRETWPRTSKVYCHRVVGWPDDAEITRRADAIGREVDELRSNSPMVGTPAEIVDKLGPFVEAGVERVYLQMLDMSDLDHLALVAGQVLPQLR